MALDIQAIAQPQRAELVLAELSCQEAPGLVAKLGDAFIHQGSVYLIVSVHAPALLKTEPQCKLAPRHDTPSSGYDHAPCRLYTARGLYQPVVCKPRAMPLTLACSASNSSRFCLPLARQRSSRSTCMKCIGSI